VEASKAHATMLKSIGILTKEELELALTGLNEILALWKEVRMSFNPNGRTNFKFCLAKRMATPP
jgi:argininosuccinate lyase